MTITQAIELLKHKWAAAKVCRLEEEAKAIGLGIEALERIAAYRERYLHIPLDILPSETRE